MPLWWLSVTWVHYNKLVFTLPFHLRNDLYCVGWGVKLYSIQLPYLCLIVVCFVVLESVHISPATVSSDICHHCVVTQLAVCRPVTIQSSPWRVSISDVPLLTFVFLCHLLTWGQFVYFMFLVYFLLFVFVLSVPVPVIAWKDSGVSEMTYYVSSRT